MKKVLTIVGGIVLGFVIVFIIFFVFTSATSKKLICKSDEGNITIMYNDETLTGYTAKGISYDLDGQTKIAKQIGVDEYLRQFTTWFETNTTGTCE